MIKSSTHPLLLAANNLEEHQIVPYPKQFNLVGM
ncbi:MAG: hypothetical protein ACI90V_001573 [Bacillariaceae sp.]|jgi:hypothetical protein